VLKFGFRERTQESINDKISPESLKVSEDGLPVLHFSAAVVHIDY